MYGTIYIYKTINSYGTIHVKQSAILGEHMSSLTRQPYSPFEQIYLFYSDPLKSN